MKYITLIALFMLLTLPVRAQEAAQTEGPLATEEGMPTQEVEEATPEVPPTDELTPTQTQEADSEIIFDSLVELASVQTIRSFFIMQLPASDFEQVILTISQEGWGEEIVEVDLAEIAEEGEENARFEYLWNIDPENPPALYEEITLIWTFFLVDDDRDEVINTLVYADPRTEWQMFQTDEITLAIPANRFDPQSIRESVQAIYDLMSENSGQSASVALTVFDRRFPENSCLETADGDSIVTTESRAQVPCDSETIREIYAANGYSTVEVLTGSAGEVQNAVTEALFDRLYAGASAPEWFLYGLKQFYTPTPKLNFLETSRQSVRGSRPITDMSTVPDDPARLRIWQAQSYGMVQYMAEQIGVPELFELAESESIEEAYESATGQSITGLITAWGNWVYTGAAERAYQYTPYLPPTPTITPSLTRTLTPTPTLTPTVTLTPTLTDTVGFTPSPFPTDTPTLTPTLTFTPRSLASLFTPTPEPALPLTISADNPSTLIGLGLIGVGIIGLIVLLIFWRPQRG
jgi:hypothetical protein